MRRLRLGVLFLPVPPQPIATTTSSRIVFLRMLWKCDLEWAQNSLFWRQRPNSPCTGRRALMTFITARIVASLIFVSMAVVVVIFPPLAAAAAAATTSPTSNTRIMRKYLHIKNIPPPVYFGQQEPILAFQRTAIHIQTRDWPRPRYGFRTPPSQVVLSRMENPDNSRSGSTRSYASLLGAMNNPRRHGYGWLDREEYYDLHGMNDQQQQQQQQQREQSTSNGNQDRLVPPPVLDSSVLDNPDADFMTSVQNYQPDPEDDVVHSYEPADHENEYDDQQQDSFRQTKNFAVDQERSSSNIRQFHPQDEPQEEEPMRLPAFPPVISGNRPFADQATSNDVVFSSDPEPDSPLYQQQQSLEDLQQQLEAYEQQIYEQNNGQKFNINSPKQVAVVLFGTTEGMTTNKDTLQIKASTGDRMSHLILEYRRIKGLLKRRAKQKELVQQGRQVQSVMSKVVTTTFASEPPSKELEDPPVVLDGTRVENMVDPITTAIHQKEVPADPLVLVDASALIFRSYHAMPPMHRQDGLPTGALMGFCNTLNRLLFAQTSPPKLEEGDQDELSGESEEDGVADSEEGDSDDETLVPRIMPRIILVFDSKEAKSFRSEMYSDYKANRKELPVDLIPQFDLIRQAASVYGICQMEAPGYEADDVIATLATCASRYRARSIQGDGNKDSDISKIEHGPRGNTIDTYILSADKDLMQLITTQEQDEDENGPGSIHMIDPMSMARTTYKEVLEKWQVSPSDLGDLLALAGDASDNIPGVQGIGPKTAATLLQDFGSLENLLNNLDKVKQNRRREMLQAQVKEARLSRRLVALQCHIPFDKLVITFASNSNGNNNNNNNKHKTAMASPSPQQPLFTSSSSSLSLMSSDFGTWVDSVRMEPINADRVLKFYDQMNFHQLKYRFRSLIQQQQQQQPEKKKRRQSWRRRPKATVPKPEDYEDVPF